MSEINTVTLRQYRTTKDNMSTPTIIGTETEFGISVKNAREQDPIAASTLVVNAYRSRNIPTISWDYAQESPLMDARGFIDESQKPIVEEDTYSVINDILINGGRYYVDHAHPEYCTPECSNARDLVKYEKAGELILDLSRLAAEQLLLDNQEIIIYKNNTDYKGHSYGYHENYLMSRKIDFSDIVAGLTPFIVTRQVITGSGKVGAENGANEADFQISQRADFFEKEVGLSTMVERPIINTRDEPHADSTLYRRLHVIVGDSNMSEFTIYLKVGITAIVLQLIEKRVIRDQFALNEPVAAIKSISRDLKCTQKIELKDGRNLTAIEIQRAYLNLAQEHLSDDERTPIVDDVMQKWDFVLNRLQKNPMSLGRHLDWIIKKNLIDAYMARHGFMWTDPQVRMLDLQYHDLRPDKGLYLRLQKNGHVERILTHEEIAHAIQHPPSDTRAYFRGTCLRRFPSDIHSVSWNSIIFNGASGFEKIMMERPHFGTQEIVGEMLNNCTVDELVNQIRDDCK